MKKKLIPLIVLLLIASFGYAGAAAAASTDNTSAVNQVFQSAKNALDSLVSAKDAGNINDVALRVDAFNQVLDLSTAEAKDFELKLLTTDKNPDYGAWVKNALDGLTNALVYYDSERQAIASSSPSLDGIKSMASDFKAWRDENYVPLLNQLQDFFLVKQEFSAIGTSEKRLGNIQSDLSSLSFKSQDEKTINGMLDAAANDIKGAKSFNNQAYDLFLSMYAEPLNATSTDSTSSPRTDSTSTSTSTSTSSSTEATSTEATSSIATSTGTSTEDVSTSSITTSTDTAVSSSTPQIVSIKGLVGSSLSKIKDAYQNFIDISNFVRKLLQ